LAVGNLFPAYYERDQSGSTESVFTLLATKLQRGRPEKNILWL